MFRKKVIYASLFALLSTPLCGKCAAEEKLERIHKQKAEWDNKLEKFIKQEVDQIEKRLDKLDQDEDIVTIIHELESRINRELGSLRYLRCLKSLSLDPDKQSSTTNDCDCNLQRIDRRIKKVRDKQLPTKKLHELYSHCLKKNGGSNKKACKTISLLLPHAIFLKTRDTSELHPEKFTLMDELCLAFHNSIKNFRDRWGF